jgi:hypothetical protein
MYSDNAPGDRDYSAKDLDQATAKIDDVVRRIDFLERLVRHWHGGKGELELRLHITSPSNEGVAGHQRRENREGETTGKSAVRFDDDAKVRSADVAVASKSEI